MTTAFERLRAALGPFLITGAPRYSNTEEVVAEILATEKFRQAFEYEREGKTYTLSSSAMLGWLKTARYWSILHNDLLSLTAQGENFKSGEFSNRLQRHLTMAVYDKWQIALSDIEHCLRQLTGSDPARRPDADNWYRLAAEAAGGQIPKVRFRQLTGFLLGCGVFRRDICHLYFLA